MSLDIHMDIYIYILHVYYIIHIIYPKKKLTSDPTNAHPLDNKFNWPVVGTTCRGTAGTSSDGSVTLSMGDSISICVHVPAGAYVYVQYIHTQLCDAVCV